MWGLFTREKFPIIDRRHLRSGQLAGRDDRQHEGSLLGLEPVILAMAMGLSFFVL